MTKSKGVNIRWTAESAKEKVLGCSTRSEARSKYPGAVRYLEQHGLIADVISQIESKKTHYSYEECIQFIRQCKTRKEFNTKYPSAADNLRWIGKYNEEIAYLDKERKDWTDETAIAEIGNGYKTQEDFRKNGRGAYGYLQKHGLLDEVKKRLPGGFRWKKEECIELAQPYETVVAFEKGCSKAYHAAYHNGWLKECCAHMKPVNARKYTNDQLQAEALKYSSKKEFMNSNSAMYRAALKYGILNEICKHVKVFGRPHSKEECREAALQCKNRTDFSRRFPALYSYCLTHNWMEEVCSHMTKRVCKERTKHEKDVVAEHASHFQTKIEFERAYPNEYGWMRSHGLINELCAHMKPSGNKYKRCIYAAEFDDHSVYVGLTYKPVERWRCERTDPSETVYKHMQKSGLEPHFKIVHDYTDKDTASILEGEYEEKYRQEGWTILNKAKTGCIGGRKGKYTMEYCVERAKHYKRLVDFEKAEYAVYSAAQKYGWLDEVRKVLPSVQRKPYTYKELKTLAAGYNDRATFWRENQGAYKAAKKMGIYEEICAHMPRQDNYGKAMRRKNEQ